MCVVGRLIVPQLCASDETCIRIPSSGNVSASPDFKCHILQVKNDREDSGKIWLKTLVHTCHFNGLHRGKD